MPKRIHGSADLATLVEHMFEQVMTEPERAELLASITVWESEHPDVDAAHRVTAWIDIAYEIRAKARSGPRTLSEVRIATSAPRLLRVTYWREAIA